VTKTRIFYRLKGEANRLIPSAKRRSDPGRIALGRKSQSWREGISR
jgi:hypothetical protein